MSTLQYANDTIMLFENDFEQARNLKIIMWFLSNVRFEN
jgi:hypothetical protein